MDETKSVYQRRAEGFDRSRSDNLFERPWLERFCSSLPKGGHVLDAGCGTGKPIAAYLIEEGYELTGIDYAQPMLDLAAARWPGATWICADLRDFDLKRRFDGVIAWHSFFHLTPDEQRQGLPVLADHVVPGGVMMMTIGPDEEGEACGYIEGEAVYHASLPEAEYRQILEDAGMRVTALARDDASCGGATVLMAQKKRASA